MDIFKELDNAKGAIGAAVDYAIAAEGAFRTIAELARDIDVLNWLEKSEEIFRIAYEHC